jgi:hypothetical protein
VKNPYLIGNMNRNRFLTGFLCFLMASFMISSGMIVIFMGTANGTGTTEEETGIAGVERPLYFEWYDDWNFDPYIYTNYLTLTSVQVKTTSITPFMYVLVNSSIYSDISDELAIYATDVERTGLGCSIWTISDSADPAYIKGLLTSAYGSGLVGCFMVGDIPPAWYHIDGMWNATDHDIEDFPCDLFYMDMDGTWADTNSDGLYDSHTAGSGDLQAEIWVGRLKTDQMTGDEVTLIEEYFARNHEYRTGDLTFSKNALLYVDDDWAPRDWLRNEMDQAFDVMTYVHDKATTAKDSYLENITDNSYTAVHLMCHGSPGGHCFKIPSGPDSIWEPGGDIYSATIKNIDDNILFYNLFVCSSARYTSNNYLAGWYVQSGDTLVALGSTKTGSMLNDQEFYNPITDSKTIGDSFQDWFEASLSNDPSEATDEWFMGMTIIGDPTIRISGKFQVTINTPGLPAGTFEDVVHYTEDGTPKTGDIVNGVWSGICDYTSQVWVDATIVGSTYTTDEQTSFTVVEPFTEVVQYYQQYQVDITFTGLTAAHPTTVHYVDDGDAKTISAWDGAPFSQLCDHGSTVWVEDPVIVTTNEERYCTEDTEVTSWVVNADVSANVEYYHQYGIHLVVDTIGVEDMDTTNDVSALYVSTGHSLGVALYDGYAPVLWADEGTDVTISLRSSASTSLHRWQTDDALTYTASGPLDKYIPYYEQYLMEIISHGLTDVSYQGTASYVQFGDSLTGNYYDLSGWQDWCDVSTTLSWDQIVAGPPCERYHNPGETDITVVEDEIINVYYHTEYKITIAAEGLPETEVSVVTIGVADPSPSDDVAGGDQADYQVTLSSPTFSWTNWVHADTTLTATELVEIAANEKYILICWTIDGSRYAPPSVNAEWSCLTYTAHYLGLKKEMSVDEADLTDSVMVHLTISAGDIFTPDDMLNISDELPNEFSFVMGSATLDGVPYVPYVVVEIDAILNQRLVFHDLAVTDHEIWFEIRVNRAYASDTDVINSAFVDLHLEGMDPMTLGVEDILTIHPYIGPTLSSSTDGPAVVMVGIEVCWEFTFIVKNNFNYPMMDAVLRDHFGAELCHLPDTLMANLMTSPDVTIGPGAAGQVRLTWTIDQIDEGEAFMLQITLCTGVNPGGNQEYSSDGWHALDSGALLKWDNERGKQMSLKAPRLWVYAEEY